MAEYKTGVPANDLRLRDWPAGRLNVLRLAVQRLEGEVNRSLGNRVEQSRKRLISEQVPFPLSLEVKPGFRQAEVNIGAAPGLGGHPRRQLLFYELQHDSSPAFPDPTILETPNPHIMIAGLGLGETRSFRARCISTLNEASVWTDTVTVTVAQSQIQQSFFTDVDVRLETPIGAWQTILDDTYTPLEAMACLNFHIAVAGPTFDVDRIKNGVTRKSLFGGPAHVQFRYRIGPFNAATGTFQLAEHGQRTMLSVRPGFSSAATNGARSTTRNPLAFGAFICPWYKRTAGTPVRILLEAAKCPGSEWLGPTRNRAIRTTDPVIFVRNAQLIEVLEDL